MPSPAASTELAGDSAPAANASADPDADVDAEAQKRAAEARCREGGSRRREASQRTAEPGAACGLGAEQRSYQAEGGAPADDAAKP